MRLKKGKYIYILLFLLFIPLSFVSGANGEGGTQAVSQGVDLFRKGIYDQSIIKFRDILLDPNLEAFHGEAYFWISKAFMVLGKLSEAEKNLEHFLVTYPASRYYAEALYQKGRLLFMQTEYEKAIQVLSLFIEKYSSSMFTSNAYFWIGESLFLLGQLDKALDFFKLIVQKYSGSFKFEAAKYRIAIIQFKKRENELLKLLKWSHMEALKAQEEAQSRERTYEQAISSYQNKLAALASGSDLSSSLAAKEAEAAALKNEKTTLEAKVKSLEAQVKSLAAGADVTVPVITDTGYNQKLLQLKEEALALKEQLLDLLLAGEGK